MLTFLLTSSLKIILMLLNKIPENEELGENWLRCLVILC